MEETRSWADEKVEEFHFIQSASKPLSEESKLFLSSQEIRTYLLPEKTAEVIQKIINEKYKGEVLLRSADTEQKEDLKNKSILASDFVTIPAGKFKMGSPPPPEGVVVWSSYADQHVVNIANDFDLMTTEVTQTQWYEVMKDDFIKGARPSTFKDKMYCPDYDEEKEICPNHPVENVSYKDVNIFIRELNKLDKNYNYRLPSEAEWEYAARGKNAQDLSQSQGNIVLVMMKQS